MACSSSIWNEDVQLEIEALQATYEDVVVSPPAADGARQGSISLRLQPQQDQPRFVEVLLRLALSEGYPESAGPCIHLADARGLGSERLAVLLSRLQEEAAGLQGEMMLGHLFESVRDFLTEHNVPEGPCMFCLEDLAPSSSTGGSHSQPEAAAAACMRLPCFHAFHQDCFVNWWCWQQLAFQQQEQQLHQQTGATAAAALMQEQLPAKCGEGLFQLTCPTCRAAFSLQQDLLPELQGQLRMQYKQQLQQQAGGSYTSSSSSSSKLTAAQLAPFADLQRRHAALFALQQLRQGIITGANYSISDWDGASAADATAAAVAAAAATGVPAAGDAHAGSRSAARNSDAWRSSGGRHDRGGRAAQQHGYRAPDAPAATAAAPASARDGRQRRSHGPARDSSAPMAGPGKTVQPHASAVVHCASGGNHRRGGRQR